jgi:uridine kinase
MSRAEVLSGLVESIQRMPATQPLRVGIDGRSGAGKTTIADELADVLGGEGRLCVRASIDDFHPPGYKHRAIAGDFTPADYLREGYDYDAFRRSVLEPLGPRGDRRCRLKLWNPHDDQPFRDEWVNATEDAILLVDGVFLLLPSIRAHWDFAIWMDVDWETMLIRAEKRDVAWVGSGALVRERYTTGWIPRHRFYEETIGPRELVDVVVDNNDVDHPFIVRSRAPLPVP